MTTTVVKISSNTSEMVTLTAIATVLVPLESAVGEKNHMKKVLSSSLNLSTITAVKCIYALINMYADKHDSYIYIYIYCSLNIPCILVVEVPLLAAII